MPFFDGTDSIGTNETDESRGRKINAGKERPFHPATVCAISGDIQINK
jgi:hypothetical protein